MRILGFDFFDGDAAGAVDRALDHRGLIVAPSGTCFRRLQRDEVYRRAMLDADLILPDSGLMVLLWRLFKGRRIRRVSGLAYLNELLGRAAFRQDRSVLWVLPNEEARDRTLRWLQSRGFLTTAENCCVAPIYGAHVEDLALLDRVQASGVSHVVIALSGGVQEKLGAYLRQNCSHGPGIHCIGAALGFIAGYQVSIPNWADQLYLGWLFRLVSNPRRFLPRAMDAFALPGMILRYREAMPQEKTETLKN